MKIKSSWGWLIVLLLSGIILCLSLGKFIASPGSFLVSGSGDPVKTYYSYLYYILHDKGLWFTGMHYPYGEHINFPDLLPLVSGLGKLFYQVLPKGAFNLIGFFNSTLLFSLWVTPVVVYGTLRQLKLPVGYSIVTALIIALLSPQVARYNTHQSLAAGWVVPLVWLLLSYSQAQPKRWLWPALLALTALVTGGLHTYFILICSAFTLSFLLVHLFQTGWFTVANRQLTLHLLAAALVPLLLVPLLLKLTDPVTDRPLNPYGLLVYHSNFASVFFPSTELYQTFWQSIFHTAEPIWEGKAYVGLPGLVLLIVLLLKAGRYLLNRKWKLVLRPVLPAPLRVGIWATVPILLVAMAYPFQWSWGLALLELIPPLKQFRSLGRLAWIFYYVYAAFVAFYLYQLWRFLHIRKAGMVGTVLVSFILIWWAIEARYQAQPVFKAMTGTPVELLISPDDQYTNALKKVGRQAQDFQAIVPLPYFSIGTDKTGMIGTEQSVLAGFASSLELHLPLMATMLTRTSISQTLSLVQLLSNPVLSKEITKKLPDKKPLLLLFTNQPLNMPEQILYRKGHLLLETSSFKLLELPLDSLQPKRPNLAAATPVTAETPALIRNSFPTSSNAAGFLDTGVLESLENEDATLLTVWKGALTPVEKGYEVSLWVDSRTPYGLPEMFVREFDQSGNQLHEHYSSALQLTDIHKGWLRHKVEFNPSAETRQVQVILRGRIMRADNLLIRPAGTDYYWKTANTTIWNNFPLE